MSLEAKEHIRDNLSNRLVFDIKQLKPMGDGRRDELGPLADQYLNRDIKSRPNKPYGFSAR